MLLFQKESVGDEEDDLFGSNTEDELCGEDGSGDFNHHQEEPEKVSVLRGVAVGVGAAPGTGGGPVVGGGAAVMGVVVTPGSNNANLCPAANNPASNVISRGAAEDINKIKSCGDA